jgi:hypothetical protein
MGDTQPTVDVSRLSSAARRAERRLRANDALRRLVLVLPVLLTCACVGLAYVRLREPGEAVRQWLAFSVIASGLALAAAVVARWVGARPAHAGALALDRHHGSVDRITNALFFAGVEPERRSPLMQAAVRDALDHVPAPDARRAVPLELPRATWACLALSALLWGVNGLSPLPSQPAVGRIPARTPPPLVLTADDVELMREVASELPSGSGDPELDAAVSRFNELVEELARGKLDRDEVFRRLAELDRSLSLADSLTADDLAATADQLAKSRLSKPIADALDKGELPEAERAMRQLAERLRRSPDEQKSDLERLQKALEGASQESEGRARRLEEARQALERERRRLLGKKRDPKSQPEEVRQAQEKLEQQRRKLEKLDRDLARARQSQAATSPLDRALADAARELMQELGESARHQESGAEALNRMAQKSMTRRTAPISPWPCAPRPRPWPMPRTAKNPISPI